LRLLEKHRGGKIDCMSNQFIFKLLTLLVAVPVWLPAQSGFTLADFKGTYTFSYDGTLNSPATGPVPVSAVGLFTLDGQGRITKAVRILNLAGQVVKQSGTGTLTIQPDGTGSSTFQIVPAEGEPAVLPPTRENFHFVFTSRNKGVGISGQVRLGNGEDVGFIAIVRAEFRRQEAP